MLKPFVRWTEVVFWLAASCPANFPSAVAGLDLESPEPSNLHIHFLFTLCAVAWAFQTTGGTKARLVRKRGRITHSCRACKEKCCKWHVGVISRCWVFREHVVSCAASTEERNLFGAWTINAWFLFFFFYKQSSGGARSNNHCNQLVIKQLSCQSHQHERKHKYIHSVDSYGSLFPPQGEK